LQNSAKNAKKFARYFTGMRKNAEFAGEQRIFMHNAEFKKKFFSILLKTIHPA